MSPISIIILQKVAAKVNFVAADRGIMDCEVRWLLRKKFFGIAAISAASLVLFVLSLYII